MGHNPLDEDLRAKAARISKLQKRRTELERRLKRRRDFNRSATVATIQNLESKVADLDAKEARTAGRVFDLRRKRKRLARKARFGPNRS